jgi:methylthioribose-1-phosphate isomerase
VLARQHEVPFYCAAPSSTIDRTLEDGSRIPLEQRPPDEVATIAGRRVVPAGAEVWNPAFDVTPGALVTGFITDRGLVRPPFQP